MVAVGQNTVPTGLPSYRMLGEQVLCVESEDLSMAFVQQLNQVVGMGVQPVGDYQDTGGLHGYFTYLPVA